MHAKNQQKAEPEVDPNEPQKMSVLGLKSNSVFFDGDDPATIAMYNRRICMREFTNWLRRGKHVPKLSSQVVQILCHFH